MSSVVKVSEFDVDQFSFEPFPEKYKRNCIQSIMLPSYKGERCPIIQLPWIEISQYGVPTKNEFFKEDTQRYFIKLPLAGAKSEELREWLETIDKKFGNSAVKKKLLGDKSKHTYQPLLRTPVSEEGGTEKMPYVKFKLQSLYPSNEITTGVVVQEASGEIRAVEASSIDDVVKYVPFKSKVRCFITPSKLWYHPSSNVDASYGVVFKCVKIFSKLPERNSLPLQIEDVAAQFAESGDESE